MAGPALPSVSKGAPPAGPQRSRGFTGPGAESSPVTEAPEVPRVPHLPPEVHAAHGTTALAQGPSWVPGMAGTAPEPAQALPAFAPHPPRNPIFCLEPPSGGCPQHGGQRMEGTWAGTPASPPPRRVAFCDSQGVWLSTCPAGLVGCGRPAVPGGRGRRPTLCLAAAFSPALCGPPSRPTGCQLMPATPAPLPSTGWMARGGQHHLLSHSTRVLRRDGQDEPLLCPTRPQRLRAGGRASRPSPAVRPPPRLPQPPPAPPAPRHVSIHNDTVTQAQRCPTRGGPCPWPPMPPASGKRLSTGLLGIRGHSLCAPFTLLWVRTRSIRGSCTEGWSSPQPPLLVLLTTCVYPTTSQPKLPAPRPSDKPTHPADEI